MDQFLRDRIVNGTPEGIFVFHGCYLLRRRVESNILNTCFGCPTSPGGEGRKSIVMRLTTYTDYSLRVLMYVAAKPDGLSTIREIADAYGISNNHLMKIVFELGRHGLLENLRGRSGGIRLARPADEIRIGEVVRFTESETALVECFGSADGCAISAPCRLKGALNEALEAFLAALDRYTLRDLVRGNRGLIALTAA